MKKILLSGLIAGIAALVTGALLSILFNVTAPSLVTQYENAAIFRPWSDPLMSLYYAYPFILALPLAWIWNKVKSLIHGYAWNRGLQFGLVYFVCASIPGMWITYSSFQVSLPMVLSWTLAGLLQGIAIGLVFAKTNK